MNALRLAACEDHPVAAPQYPPECNGWAIYRDRTVAMLRKYFRMSLDLGRVPSVLGGQLFRARITHYEARNFEDVVIFVHDMENCLRRLDPVARLMLARVVLQDYTHDEVAAQCRISRRQVIRRLEEALDRTSELLVDAELMRSLHEEDLPPRKPPARAEPGSWTEDA